MMKFSAMAHEYYWQQHDSPVQLLKIFLKNKNVNICVTLFSHNQILRNQINNGQSSKRHVIKNICTKEGKTQRSDNKPWCQKQCQSGREKV